ncbi:MAG: aspartate--ammonia ligase [Candidatus Aminicenantales bacterium]
MSQPWISRGHYSPVLDTLETERAIKLIKDFFQSNLAQALRLRRVTAPFFVRGGTGINDDLNGIEKPVSFAAPSLGGVRIEIVQSLAKWKRLALRDLRIKPGFGIYTDMNALRPDEVPDEMHSLYVDQWDWEKTIRPADRNLEYLKRTVRRIYGAVRSTESFMRSHFPKIKPVLPEEISFVHTRELEERYPDLTPAQRENELCRERGAIFVIGVGGALRSGKPHDGRAPDYDDWTTATKLGPGLNGDIVIWNPVLDRAFEISSMGIRVDPASLQKQLELRGQTKRRELYFHKELLAGRLPLSVGGGIGQSRLCMFYMRKAHIGEVQASLWPETMIAECRKKRITLL